MRRSCVAAGRRRGSGRWTCSWWPATTRAIPRWPPRRRWLRGVVRAAGGGAVRRSAARRGCGAVRGAGSAAAARRHVRAVPLFGGRAGRCGDRRRSVRVRHRRTGRRTRRRGAAQQRGPGGVHQPGQGARGADDLPRVVLAGDSAATLALGPSRQRDPAAGGRRVAVAAGPGRRGRRAASGYAPAQ